MSEKVKEFKVMTPAEQLAWITDFTQWTAEKLPVLCALGNAWESNSIKSMEEGLRLISAFGYCRDFVEKSLLFRDFARRIDRMNYYIGKIKKEIAQGHSLKASTGETLAVVPQVQPRRRGRPTKEESARMAQQQQLEAQEKEKAEAVARLVGKSPEPPVSAAPMQGDLFSAPVAAPVIPATPKSDFAAALSLSSGEARLHLDQLAWLMSPSLQHDVKTIAGLRATAAKESNQAKELALNGVSEVIIAPHSQAAVEATNAYKAIYAAIDRELGELYSLLYIGGEHIPSWEQKCQSKGITLDQLKGILKPYWEKVGCPTVQLESVTEAPTVISDEEKKQRQARLHNIRTFFMRKDRKLTAARVEKMREYIEEVRGYGLTTEEYEAVLAKAEEDLKQEE